MSTENLAVAAVMESISLTDVLSPFINTGDKEPSWDGNIYIHESKKKSKEGVKEFPFKYQYEPEVILEGKVKRPDFKIIDADTGEEWYWEHCGMMSDTKYAKRWADKEKFYDKNGIVRGKNLIVTEEYAGEGLNSHEINKMIKEIFLV